MNNRTNYLLVFPALVCLVSSGCATGMWKPLAPWSVGQQHPSAINNTMHARPAQPAIGSGVDSAAHPGGETFPNEITIQDGPTADSPSQGSGYPSVDSPGSNSNSQMRMFRGQSPQESGVQIPAEGIGVPSGIATTQGDDEDSQEVDSLQSDYTQASNGIPGTTDINPLVAPYAAGVNAQFPQNYADLDIYLSETNTGRINIGGAYNSDSGLVGQFVIDERNFDITRFPRSFRDIVDGVAWRGGGQNFRMELVPGNDVQRYLVSFSEPFLFNSAISLSTSLYYFKRQFYDWDEERLGGRFALGYRLTPDISISTGLRLENVEHQRLAGDDVAAIECCGR